jgi:hypothetical protein
MAINFDHQRDRISTSSGTLTINTTGSLVIPVGNISQRPTGFVGHIRYNSELQTYEGYDGISWTSLGGVIDSDKDTYIIAKPTPGLIVPGTEENTLYFVTNGVERLAIAPNGLFAFGDGLNKLTVDWATGNTNIAGTLTVQDQLTVNSPADFTSITADSLAVSNLTNDRLLVVGAAGAVEDDPNLTFNGDVLSIGQGNFTVDQSTGNVYALGTVDVDGQATIASLAVTDILQNRVVIAGVNGELEGSNNLTFDGTTLAVTGDMTVTGDITIGGNIIIGDEETDSITVSADFTSNLVPNEDVVYDLGTTAKNWQTIHVSTIDSNTEVVTVDTTGGLVIPVGTTLERPTAVTGMIRFNVDDGRFEAYDGTAWTGVGGVIDVDQNTYIVAETSPGANNNDLDFYTDGTQRLQINEVGNFLYGDGLNKFTIDWATGDTNIAGDISVGGNATITGDLQVDGAINFNSISVAGQATFDSVNIEDLTDNRIVIVGVNGELEDDPNLTFDGTTFNIGTSNFTVDVSTGNTDLTGTLTVGLAATFNSTVDITDQATIASLAVEDLTGGRIVFAGLGGELQDNELLTFTGTTLILGPGVTNKFSVDGITGNTYIDGTLTANGVLTATDIDSSTLDTTGNVSVGGSLSVIGTSIFTGDVTADNLDTNTLDVVANSTFGGTIVVTGQSTFNNDMTATNISSTSVTTTGDATIGGQLEVTGNITGNNINGESISVTGNADVDGTLDVANTSTLRGDVTLTGASNFVIQNNIPTNSFSVNGASGNTFILGTLDVEGQTTLVSAAVEDLTENRVVLASTGGELVDSADLTFDGTALNVGQGNFTVDAATGNVETAGNLSVLGNVFLGDDNSDVVTFNADVNSNIVPSANETFDLGTETDRWRALYARDVIITDSIIIGSGNSGSNLDVEGQSTFDSVNVEDLTNDRIVIVGANGELEDDANLTFNGTTFKVGTNITDKFTVDVATGNTYIQGTLETDAQATFASVNVEDLASNRIVVAGAGGELEGDANFTWDGSNLNVTGSQTISGTLDVDGQTTLASANIEDLTSGRIVLAGTNGELEDSANLTFDGSLLTVNANQNVSGNLSITGNLTVNGTTTTVNSTTVTIDDPVFTLGGDTAPTVDDNKDRGIEFRWNDGITAKIGFFGFDDSTGYFTFIPDATNSSEVFSGQKGTLDFSTGLFENLIVSDIQIAVSNATTIDTVNGDLVLGADSNIVSVPSNLEVGTEATLASAIVSDLTVGRVVIVGTNGALQDSNNLTFEADQLNINGSFVVDNITADANTISTVSGNLNLTSSTNDVVISSAVISDLTENRIVIVGASGALEDDANFTFDGTTFSVTATNNFVGDTNISNNLDVGSQATLASANIEDLTNTRIVVVGVNGELQDDPDFIYDGTTFKVGTDTIDKFTVDVNSGNTDIAGTLDVNGQATLASVNVDDLTIDRIVLVGASGELIDSADLGFDSIDLNVGQGSFTVNVSTGNTGIAGTLNVSGQSTLASAAVSDLTDGRVVLAGTSGELEDSANLTFDGTTLSVTGVSVNGTAQVTGSLTVDNISIDGNTISSLNLNGDILLSPNGTGEVVANTLTVSDLTDNRIVIAGTAGELEDDANFRYDGVSLLIGPAGNESFTVEVTNGNTVVAGTLDVNAQATLASAAVSDLTSGRIVLAGTAGELEDSANLTFNGTLLALTGNQTISGTLEVDSQTTIASLNVEDLTSGRVVLAGTNGELEDSTNLTFDGTLLSVTGNASVSGTLDIDGQTTLASANIEDLTDNRIVIAGVNGELEDDANFIFDGNVFNVGSGNFTVTQSSGNVFASGTVLAHGNLTIGTGNEFTVDSVTGNVSTVGTLNVDSQATLASANIEDLTSGRIVLAGTNGELEDNANFTFDGSILAATATFNLTGNQTVTGTLDVNGQTTLASVNVEDLTDNRIVVAGASGELEDNANFTFDGTTFNIGATGEFTVAVSSGNTQVKGTLDVDSQTTLASANIEDLTSGRVVLAGTSGELEDNANLTFNGTELTTSSLTVSDLTNNRIVISGTAGSVEDSEDLTFDGTSLNVGQGNFTVDVTSGDVYTAGNVSINGNLTVDGITTTVNSTTVTIDDPIFTLGGDTAPTVDDDRDRGIEFRWHDGSNAKTGFFGFDDSTGKFTFIPDGVNTAEVYSGAAGDAVFGSVELSDVTAGNIQIGVTTANTIDTISGDLTLDSAGGNIIINDNINVSGEATLASAVVSDLTDNRIVIAGLNGALEDSANLTFDGSVLTVVATTNITGTTTITGELNVDNINIDGNTITSTDGNGNINLTPNGTGEVVASTLTVSDLTDNRILVAGVNGAVEDDANLTFNGTTLAVGVTNFTVDSTSGNTFVSGTLEVDSQTTLASAAVEDLTINRIVTVGINGELQDDSNLFFDGNTFKVGTDTTDKFTVAVATGNTTIAGSLNAGETTVSNATVSSLTNNRIIIAGTNGLLEDDSNFTFDAATFNIGQGNFTVDVATGNTVVAGTLDAGDLTASSAAITDLTNNRIVIAGVNGELEDDANFTFDGTTLNLGQNNFTVDTSGNTVVGGTLDVTNDTNITSVTGSTNTTTGALVVAGGAGIGENLYVGGNVSIVGTLGTNGGVTIGDDNTSDVLTLNARITGDLTPTVTDTYDIGSALLSWKDFYLSESINFTGTASGDNEIIIPNNLADAFSITESGGDIIVVDTTAGNRQVTIDPALLLDTSLKITNNAGSTTVNIILDEDDMISNSDTALATQQSIKAYIDNVQSDTDLNFSGDTGTGTVNLLTQTFALSGTANEIETSASGQTITIGLPNNITVGNNLTVTNDLIVNGTNATFNVSNVQIEDPIITIGGTTPPLSNDSKDKGIEFRFFEGSARTGFFGYDISQDAFTFVKLATNNSEVITGTAGDVIFGSGTFNGLTIDNVQIGVSGDNTIDTSVGNLTLDSASGTVEVADAFSVSGEATLASATISDLTDNRIVIAGPNGSLEDDANFRFDGTSFEMGPNGGEVFTVDVATGATTIQGTVNSNGQTNLNGNTAIGSDATDTVAFNALVASNFIPSTTDTRDLGSTSYAWRDLYIGEAINFRGATSENEIVVPTNQVDALSIRDNAGTPNDLIVFTTTTNNQLITITPNVQLDGTFTINGGVTVNNILDEDTLSSNSETALATQQSIKAYVDNENAAQDLDFAGDSGTGSVLLDSETLTIAGTANEIETTASGQTITIGLPSNVTIANNLNVGGNTIITGDLTVNGTTTTVNTTELVVSDNIITLNEGELGAGVTAGSSGIEIDRGTEATKSWVWDETNDRWTAGTDDIEGGEFYGTIDGGTF